MASIGTILPTDTNSGTTGSGSSSNSSSSSSTATDPLANESTFLTLLVSQLQNQDPSSPMDGTTFVTQLAQFSDLEQELASRQDLDALSTKFTGTSSTTTTDSSTSGASSSTGTTGSTGTDGSGATSGSSGTPQTQS